MTLRFDAVILELSETKDGTVFFALLLFVMIGVFILGGIMMKRPCFSQYRTEALFTLLSQDQATSNEFYRMDLIFEIEQRFKEYSVVKLCMLHPQLPTEDLKRICTGIVYEKLFCCGEMLEVHSLQEIMSQMSLEQISKLTTQTMNELVYHCTQQELHLRIAQAKQDFEKREKRLEKKKGKEEYAKHKRK